MEDPQTVTELAPPAHDLSESLGKSSRFVNRIKSAYLASAMTLPHLHSIKDDGRRLLQAVSSRSTVTGCCSEPGLLSSARRAPKRSRNSRESLAIAQVEGRRTFVKRSCTRPLGRSARGRQSRTLQLFHVLRSIPAICALPACQMSLSDASRSKQSQARSKIGPQG
jgi:hypothetical protein